HERRLRLKGVQIQVKGERVLRLASQILPGEDFGGVNGVVYRVDMRIDLVRQPSLRKRLVGESSARHRLAAHCGCKECKERSANQERARDVHVGLSCPRNRGT